MTTIPVITWEEFARQQGIEGATLRTEMDHLSVTFVVEYNGIVARSAPVDLSKYDNNDMITKITTSVVKEVITYLKLILKKKR